MAEPPAPRNSSGAYDCTAATGCSVPSSPYFESHAVCKLTRKGPSQDETHSGFDAKRYRQQHATWTATFHVKISQELTAPCLRFLQAAVASQNTAVNCAACCHLTEAPDPAIFHHTVCQLSLQLHRAILCRRHPAARLPSGCIHLHAHDRVFILIGYANAHVAFASIHLHNRSPLHVGLHLRAHADPPTKPPNILRGALPTHSSSTVTLKPECANTFTPKTTRAEQVVSAKAVQLSYRCGRRTEQRAAMPRQRRIASSSVLQTNCRLATYKW